MNNGRKFVKSIFQVVTSRGIMLASEIFIGLVLPKILGVSGYGYLKIYSLYTAYTALLHFGFADGILMRFSGLDYEALNRREMRTYSRFFIIFQLAISGLFLLGSAWFLSGDYQFIGVMLGINLLIVNLTAYYQFISQATQRFKELSERIVLLSAVKLILIALLYGRYRSFGGQPVPYQWYIAAANVAEGMLLLWYIYTYRDITFGHADTIAAHKNEIWTLFKSGICLTLAYQVAHLVLVLDRQFVSMFYATEVYSLYAFAYSIIAVFTKLISSVSQVLFPMLRRIKMEAAISYYPKAQEAVAIVAGLALAGYFPLTWMIQWVLPEYTGALEYFRVVLPASMFTSCISVTMFTFYKVLDENMIYFKSGCIALAVGIGMNISAQMIFRTPAAISWASVLTVAVWYLMAGRYFVLQYGIRWKRDFLYILFLSCVYYVISFLTENWLGGLFLYGCGYLGVTAWYLFFGRDVCFVQRQ